MAENKDYKFVDHYEFDEELLKKAFAEARKIYKERGFMRKMGFGKAPAITTVDMAKAWMSEGHPFTCDHSEEVCANALKAVSYTHLDVYKRQLRPHAPYQTQFFHIKTPPENDFLKCFPEYQDTTNNMD